MEFNSAFKGLIQDFSVALPTWLPTLSKCW